jgi:ABC-type multidrug transport system ATPase subunit/ABC-type multidrug transport system permease subunit
MPIDESAMDILLELLKIKRAAHELTDFVGAAMRDYLNEEIAHGNVCGTLTSSFMWRNVTFQDAGESTLLNDVCGLVAPKTLTYVVGGINGAAATLFEILSGCSMRGRVASGEMSVDKQHMSLVARRARNLAKQQRLVSYISRNDIHPLDFTVRESVLFSIQCRAPASMSMERRIGRLEIWLLLFELSEFANRLVRHCGARELKMLHLAMETVCVHPVVLISEVTNCLDSACSQRVIRLVKLLAETTNAAYIISLTQAHDELIHCMDNITLLTEGYLAYFGTHGGLRHFLEAQGIKIPLPTEMTMAEFYERVSIDPSRFGGIIFAPSSFKNLGETFRHHTDSFDSSCNTLVDAFEDSIEYKHLLSQLHQQAVKCQAQQETASENVHWSMQQTHRAVKFVAPMLPQNYPAMWQYVQRNIILNRRNYFNAIRIFGTTGFALIMVWSFEYISKNRNDIYANRIGLVYQLITCLALYTLPCLSVMGRLNTLFFSKEWSQGYGSTSDFFWALIVSELPVNLFSVFLFSAIAYVPLEMNRGGVVYFSLMLSLMLFGVWSACLFVTASFKSSSQSVLFMLIWFNLSQLTCGFLDFYEEMPKPFQVLYWFFNLFTFGFRGIMLNEMADWPTCVTQKIGSGDVINAINSTLVDGPTRGQIDEIDFIRNGPLRSAIQLRNIIDGIEFRENITFAECVCLELPESRYRLCVERGEELSFTDVYESQQLYRWSDEDSLGLDRFSCVAFQMLLIFLLLSYTAIQLSRDNRLFNPSESVFEKVTLAVNKHAGLTTKETDGAPTLASSAKDNTQLALQQPEPQNGMPNDVGGGVLTTTNQPPATAKKFVRGNTMGRLFQAKKDDDQRSRMHSRKLERATVCILVTDLPDCGGINLDRGVTSGVTSSHQGLVVAKNDAPATTTKLKKVAPADLSKATSLPLTHKDWKMLWRTTTGESSNYSLPPVDPSQDPSNFAETFDCRSSIRRPSQASSKRKLSYKMSGYSRVTSERPNIWSNSDPWEQASFSGVHFQFQVDHFKHASSRDSWTPSWASNLRQRCSNTVWQQKYTPVGGATKPQKDSGFALNGVLGNLLPGTLGAVIGLTGSGKTTLLDILAGTVFGSTV